MTKSVFKIAVLAMALPLALVVAQSAADNDKTRSAAEAGRSLQVPHDYRTTYNFLGSWAAAADDGQGSQEIHVVYASPGSIAAYLKNQRFPDGAVLVKEVYEAVTAPMTTGTISHEDKLRGWFVMVKDSQGHHSPNDLWGDGWGWSWFDAGNPSTPSRSLPVKGGGEAASLDYRSNCKPCHQPAQSSDFIYVEGYPLLKH